MIHLAIIALVAALGQTSQPGGVRHIHGVIDRSETWSGTIVITDDVSIEQGNVTVEPGTIIEFAKAQPPGPVLKVGSDRPNGGQLILKCETAKPITFQTRANTAPGTIRIELSPRATRVRQADGTIDSKDSILPTGLGWQFVRLSGLADPAVAITAPNDSFIGLYGCRFSKCGQLLISTKEKSNITIDACVFADSTGRVALKIIGTDHSGSQVRLQQNLLDAALSFSHTPADIEDNVLIGSNACLSIGEARESRIRVHGNYVHNTSTFDEGRYCLNCESPGAWIFGNFFRGGAFVVFRGSKQMNGNVFVGEEKPSGAGAQAGRTQSLVSQLPAGALFEHNILIGPASSMLSPQSWPTKDWAAALREKTVIRNNTFDGARRSPRAIHLGEVGRAPATFEIYNNLFFRVECMLFDERASKTDVALCDHNASAPTPAKRYDRATVKGKKDADSDWGKSDVQRNSIGEIGLLSLRDPLPDFDSDANSRFITVQKVLEQIDSYYRPDATSPLVRGGRLMPESKVYRETIGACEPDPAKPSPSTSPPAKP